MITPKAKKLIQQAIKDAGFKGRTELKKYLKEIAVNEYGCFMGEIKSNGIRFYYTSNPNHFCSFGVALRGVGMTSTYALDKSSMTKAGINRGAGNYFIKWSK